eukprot:m.26117 g.26117  ORF g.26117 m.26117 type:complete len:317 (+) comp6277_c0_seq1:89-1039(+)
MAGVNPTSVPRCAAVPFIKMHGNGNDFMLVDGVSNALPRSLTDPETVRRLASRRTGIGFDQLMICRGSDTETAAFVMDIFNTDGSRASMCGNGARCFATFVRDHAGLTEARTFKVCIPAAPSPSGHARAPRVVELDVRDAGVVSVDMGIPDVMLEPKGIVVPRQLLASVGEGIQVVGVSIGNPHCVVLLPQGTDVDEIDVASIGREIGTSVDWSADGCNVEFVVDSGRQKSGPWLLKLRVWERGCGETLSCGSGSCAAVVAYSVLHPGSISFDEASDVQMPGGTLSVRIARSGTVQLSGPTETAFVGHVSLSSSAL